MVKAVRREEAEVFNLPGRDWLLYVGPESVGAANLTVGWATFPPGSAPPGHVHPTHEHAIFITPPRAAVRRGAGPLEMVTSFSPPVVPGSYENRLGGSQ